MPLSLGMTIPGSTPRSARSRAAIASWTAAWLLCAGCDLFSDLDRFEQDADEDPTRDAGSRDGGERDGGAAGDAGTQDLGCDDRRTLCVRLDLFSPHVDELVTIDLVTVADNILRARAVLDPIGGVRADVVMPLAIPDSEVPGEGEEHPLHIEIFADQDKSGAFTPDGGDHTWNLDLSRDGNLVFVHDTLFTSIAPRPRDIGVDFRMQFTDMDPHVGQLLEVMVIEVASGRTVGVYRTTSIPGANFDITIPGVIDPDGTVYRVEFYADLNDNGRYDDPPIDHTWVIELIESGADGVDASFRHGTNFADLTYQFEFDP